MTQAQQHRKTILFLPKWFPDLRRDNTGNFIQRHAEAAALYHDIIVISVKGHDAVKAKSRYFFNQTTQNNVCIIRAEYKKSGLGLSLPGRLFNLLYYYLGYYKAYQILRKQFRKPDLVHVHVLFQTALVALVLKWVYNIPYLITEHWSGYLPQDASYGKMHAFRKLLTKVVVKKALCITTVSSDLKNWMLTHGLENKYYIVPNVINRDIFHLRQTPEVRKRKKYLIHVSNLNEEKNITGILAAIAEVANSRRDFELHIVGGQDPHLIEKANKHQLLDRLVFFHHYQTEKEIAEKLNRADFFLLFSHYENMPLVLVESLACGTPVIASKVGGISEFINKTNGVLVDPGNEEQLKDAILYMLDHSQTYCRETLSTYALINFSYESIGKKFSDIYQAYCLPTPNPAIKC